MPEMDIALVRGERVTYYFIEIQDAVTFERVALPATVDESAAHEAYRILASIYGEHNLFFYRWDVACYIPAPA